MASSCEHFSSVIPLVSFQDAVDIFILAGGALLEQRPQGHLQVGDGSMSIVELCVSSVLRPYLQHGQPSTLSRTSTACYLHNNKININVPKQKKQSTNVQINK